MYAGGYPSSSAMMPSTDLQTSSWNPYAAVATASNIGNTTHQVNYDPNMYYASYYPDMFTQQYYPAQQQAASQSQAQLPVDQTVSPNGFPPSSTGGVDKNYPHVSR